MHFSVQPTNTAIGATITPAVVIDLENPIGRDSVTLSIAVNPPGDAVLSGTLTRVGVAGIVTFNNLSINKAGTGYKLAVSTGQANVVPAEKKPTSATFNVA